MDCKEIREIRREMGKTQKEFSVILGVSHNSVQLWETGKRNPSVGALALIKEVYRKFKSKNTLSVSTDTPLNNEQSRKLIPYYPDIIVTNSDVEMFDQITKSQTESKMMYDPNLEGADFVLPNFGDSNYPDIRPGDLVGYRKLNVKSFESLNLDLIYMIVTVNEQRMNKKLQIHKEKPEALWAISLNSQNYKPFPILKEDIIDVYEIVGVSRRFSN